MSDLSARGSLVGLLVVTLILLAAQIGPAVGLVA